MKTTTNRIVKIEHKGMHAIAEFDNLISDEDAKNYLIEDIERKLPRDYPEFEYSCRHCGTDKKPYKKILGVGGFMSPDTVDIFVCPVCSNHEDLDDYKNQKEAYEFILHKRQKNGFFEKTNYINPRRK